MTTIVFTFAERTTELVVTATCDEDCHYMEVMKALDYNPLYIQQPMVTEDGGRSYRGRRLCDHRDLQLWLSYLTDSTDRRLAFTAMQLLHAQAPRQVVRRLDFRDAALAAHTTAHMPLD